MANLCEPCLKIVNALQGLPSCLQVQPGGYSVYNFVIVFARYWAACLNLRRVLFDSPLVRGMSVPRVNS